VQRCVIRVRPSIFFEDPDESTYCIGQGELDHSSSNLSLNDAPFHLAGALAARELSSSCGEWPIDFH
jgi:hypothetical protein